VLDGVNADREAAFLEGPKGKLYRGFISDIPELDKKLAGFPDPQPQITDFHHAVRTRRRFALNESNAHRSCTLVNMAKIALRLGRILRFDPDTQRFIGDEQANRFVDQPMRAPWSLT
jgi:myo-inositol 2-dehydrogenase/D-chiro-inositol 1-dehydrogenase